MNRPSPSRPALRLRPQAVFFFFLATLPSATLAQKTAAPPAATPGALSPPSGPSLALSQKEALSQKQMLADDKRLDRLISLDVISVPLDEVLQKESVNKSADAKPGTDTKPDPDKLVLAASHNCEDLKLQIRLNHRPLRMLMTALAEMLPGTWTRTKEGYNLSLTDKAVLARAEWWRLFLGERDKALASQRQAVLAAMQNKARRRQIGDPDPEQSDRAIEEDAADQHDFFHSLPPALKEQIAANLDESPFYEVGDALFSNEGERAGTVGWLSQMPPETQEKFKAAMQNNVSRLAQAPPAYQKYAVQAQSGLAALDPNKVYFLFLNGGFTVIAMPLNCPPGVSSTLSLRVPSTVTLLPLMLNQTRLADAVYGGAEMSPSWKRRAAAVRKMGDAATPEMRMLTYDVYGMGEAAPDEWKRLAAYQRGRVWPNALPNIAPERRGGAAPAAQAMQPHISRAAQTDWLGEQGHMEYVSDYYSHGGYQMPPEQKKQPVRRPLAAELDEMAAKRDVSWRKDADGITLIRNNRWYRDDNLEVPQPLLRRWFGALLQSRRQYVAAQAAVPVVPQSPQERAAAWKQDWDWAAEVFSALTPWQIRNGLALFQPEEKDQAPQNDATAAKLFEGLKHQVPNGIAPPDYDEFAEMTRTPPFFLAVDSLKRYPHTVHLYGSLDDAGRAALLAGRLPASVLIPSQTAEAVSLLPQAMQNLPADSVLLSLPPGGGATDRILFGAPLPTDGLKVVTPQGDPPGPPSP